MCVKFFDRAGSHRLGDDNANAAGNGGGLCNDFGGWRGNIVSAAGGNVAHIDDDRFLLVEEMQLAVDKVAGGCRTAAAVHVHDDGADTAVAPCVANLLLHCDAADSPFTDDRDWDRVGSTLAAGNCTFQVQNADGLGWSRAPVTQ